VLARADYNYDGGITLGEARAYGRAEFSRADRDRNGVLVRGELRRADDEFTEGRRGRDGAVTYAEYEANLTDRFYRLDQNRDGYLSRYELGSPGAAPAPAPRPGAAWSVGWHWSL
jgi:Ca2+-binding EF-hand superfamily protein